MLAMRTAFGHGRPRARKFSTVDELVNVNQIGATLSELPLRAAVCAPRAPFGTANASSTIAPVAESCLGKTSRAFSARTTRMRSFSMLPCFLEFAHHRFGDEFFRLKIDVAGENLSRVAPWQARLRRCVLRRFHGRHRKA